MPLTKKATIINDGIIKINVSDLFIKSSLIAGSNRYATDDVLAANIKDRTADIKILSSHLKSNLVVTILLGVSIVLNVIFLVVKNKMLTCNVCFIVALVILKFSIEHLVKHPDLSGVVSDRSKQYLNSGNYVAVVAAGVQCLVCLNMICTN